MSVSVQVRCPACRREHHYTAPSYPCACGTPVTPLLDRLTAPSAVAHRSWDDEWITLRCPACGRRDQWPHPELGCACGTVLRLPVTDPPADAHADPSAARSPGHFCADPAVEPGPEPASSSSAPAPPGPEQTPKPHTEGARKPSSGALPHTPQPQPPTSQTPRPQTPVSRTPAAPTPTASRSAFRPVAIRTARDAVASAALYLNWLGHRDVRRADQRPTSGIGLASRGLLAQVDPSVRPTTLRDVECLWLTAMTESAECVYFSLAGYADDARARADQLCVPLFVLDLTGTPQPVNAPADALDGRDG
ncbi:hypothetical protein PYK79_47575 [Streptomyces sp. ID05-04B]|uniref:hypothetical protein n=1 Tax=unclassified Streptomyces TaxID=2593676 RepID=UPI000D19EC0B|nr:MULTISPECIES: hypothetical protein [unclassified Streptomyces]AVV47800.1 hypothetical protein C6376_30320 [Streptomyces sp. P3]MDX5569400.1 hypothetical protein [Streptomyces sp. ID05-04B]